MLNSCLGVFFPQTDKSSGYILKTSGHAYVHIVNLHAPGLSCMFCSNISRKWWVYYINLDG